jgi:hypothetical protein
MSALFRGRVKVSPKVCLPALCFMFSSLAFVALVAPAHASQVRRLNLEQMTQHASRILHGRCTSVTASVDPDLHQTVTLVTLVPYRSMKGAVHGKLTIKLLGDQTSQAPVSEATEGIPSFEEGEEVVLFLYGDSRSGLTSPVGFGQGKFKILPDKNRKLQAVNGFGNEKLLQGMSPEAQSKLGHRLEHLQERQQLPLGDFLDMVQVLAGKAQ